MLDKDSEPSAEQIREYIGEQSYGLLTKLEDRLKARYDLSKELRFPFGNSYGWGFRYGHRTKLLCYLFFEKGAITITVQIGSGEVPGLNEHLGSFLPRTKELWEGRYPCGGGGGWVHYRVFSEDELSDVIKIITVKKKPVR
ncbi:MAG: DUF3788 domain-containing protein [Candidatus Methanoplasma sp.]|nr:DUF3788 domain-containing protein [Candidatus Methanoplasma sp.]